MLLLAALHWSVQELWPFGLLPLALGAAVLGYRRTTPPLSGAQRLPLVGLRGLAYTLLLLILASPVITRQRHSPQAPRVAVLIDESASMSSVDSPGGPSRHARARTALEALRDALRGSDIELEVVPFAAAPGTPSTPEAYLAGAAEPRGAGTDLARALAATTDRLAGANLQALVVLSDGRPTQGDLDAGDAGGLGRPVFTLGIGDSLPPADLAIGRCEYSPFAYLESESVIGVRVESIGFRGQSTTLRLIQGDREVHPSASPSSRNAGARRSRSRCASRRPGGSASGWSWRRSRASSRPATTPRNQYRGAQEPHPCSGSGRTSRLGHRVLRPHAP